MAVFRFNGNFVLDDRVVFRRDFLGFSALEAFHVVLFSLKFLDWQDVDLGGDRFGLHGFWLDGRGLGFIDVYGFLGLFWGNLRERSLERVPKGPGGKGFLL